MYIYIYINIKYNVFSFNMYYITSIEVIEISSTELLIAYSMASSLYQWLFHYLVVLTKYYLVKKRIIIVDIHRMCLVYSVANVQSILNNKATMIFISI